MKAILILCFVAAAAASAIGSPKLQPATEPFSNGLRPRVQKWSERFPYLKRVVEQEAQSSSKIVKAVTNRGFLHFSQEVALQAIEGVEEANFDPFVDYMVSMLEIPGNQKDSVIKEVFLPIRWADNADWLENTITFSTGKGETKHVCILGHRNERLGLYDFVVADFKNRFELAPDILVVTERKSALWGLFGRSTTRIEKIPASLTSKDIEVLTNFFDLSAFARFAKMLDVSLPRNSGFEIDSSFVDPLSVIAIVNAGLDTFKKITEVFKTTITNTILKEIMGVGFTHYVQRTKVQIVQGIRQTNMMNGFVPLVPKLFDLHFGLNKDIESQFLIATFSDSNRVNDAKYLFNTDKSSIGNVRFVDILIKKQKEEDNPKFDIIIANVYQEFRLAPDVIVMETSRSFVGGIFQDNKIKFIERPRALKESDLEMLMAFLHVTVFKRIAGQTNVQIKYPDPKPQLK